LGCPDPGSPKQPIWHSPRSAYDAAFAGGPEVEETQFLDGGGVVFSQLGLKPLKKTWVNMMYLQVY